MPHFKAKSGIEWNYEIEGEGDVLLFIHGWGVDRRIWRQQFKYFSKFFKVVSVDLPGHGKSGWVKVDLKRMAQDLDELIASLGLNKLTIIGSSLGGLLAFKYYEYTSEKIQRLIFVGAMPKFSKSDGYPHGLDIEKMRKLGGQLQSDYPSIVNVFFRSLFTKEERQSRRFKWLQKFRQTDKTPIRQALIEYLDILEEEDLRHVLATIKVPVQFINGREDEICTQDTVKFMKEKLPNARYDFFERCGHFPFLSKPHEFNEIMESFLKESTL